jgi:3-oxoacyl-[acyl-carrier-protein] synthase II
LTRSRRVVVTGLGVITPFGLNVATMWEALLAGKSGVNFITAFDTTDFPVKICAPIVGFDPLLYLDAK